MGAEKAGSGRVARWSERAAELGVTVRKRFWWADAGFEAFSREVVHGGGLLAGGLAYRLFLWLLPIGLVGAQLLGIWVDVNDEGVEAAAKEYGIGAAAVATAADAVETNPTNRVLLLLVGLWLLAWFSVGFVRALQLAYAIAWEVPRPRLRKPLWAVLFFNGLVLAVTVGSSGLAWLRAQLGLLGILGIGATIAYTAAAALLVMWFLPRRATRWQELLPGAVLIAVGAQLLNVAVVFYLAPRIGRSSELYGALGTASVLLIWLYLVARLITSGAFLNAELWERRHPEQAQATTEYPPSTTTV
ncbi:MAG TPA: YhjD/YihY/BrkB family envelope integrity protein [Gaiellaceae bacterium]|nr:YhjD/YihY/BrkB family envelope integrity protein [Gaiellaceae bacterium]